MPPVDTDHQLLTAIAKHSLLIADCCHIHGQIDYSTGSRPWVNAIN
jgi:hypothetical protein